MDELERKTVSFEIKDLDEEEGTFSGYAATFSDKPDSYGDIIDPGAFKRTISKANMGNRIKILWNHYVLEPIGKPTKLKEDEKGLYFEGKLSLGVQRAKEVLTLMKDGVITEMSIGYNTIKDSYDSITKIRHLQEIKLWDISPVSFAANPEAIIGGVKVDEVELKPFPNEHACRLRNPDDFEKGSFKRMTRTSGGKKYSVIMGKLEGEDNLTEQAYRYNKDVWDKDDAHDHCTDHDGTFEAASGSAKEEQEQSEEDKAGRVLSAANIAKIRAAVSALNALLSAASEEDSEKSTPLTDEDATEIAEIESLVSGLKADNEGSGIAEAERRIEAVLKKLQTK